MPPEVRISSVTFDGKVSLTFTNEMVIPGNFTDILNDRNKKTEILTVVSNNKTRSLSTMLTKQDYLHLVMLCQESEETIRGNLTSWTVTKADSKEIKIQLEFE